MQVGGHSRRASDVLQASYLLRSDHRAPPKIAPVLRTPERKTVASQADLARAIFTLTAREHGWSDHSTLCGICTTPCLISRLEDDDRGASAEHATTRHARLVASPETNTMGCSNGTIDATIVNIPVVVRGSDCETPLAGFSSARLLDVF
jgi:hypothetical protein